MVYIIYMYSSSSDSKSYCSLRVEQTKIWTIYYLTCQNIFVYYRKGKGSLQKWPPQALATSVSVRILRCGIAKLLTRRFSN